jgi:hypothetical protein
MLASGMEVQWVASSSTAHIASNNTEVMYWPSKRDHRISTRFQVLILQDSLGETNCSLGEEGRQGDRGFTLCIFWVLPLVPGYYFVP